MDSIKEKVAKVVFIRKRLLELKEDRALYTELSARGRPYVSSEFDRKVLADQYLKIIEKLVA